MPVQKSWSAWWRKFLGWSCDGTSKALEILSRRYIDASQDVVRFTHHADRMQYAHFRNRLLTIATEKAKHSEWIAEKIKLLGGRLPDVPPLTITEKTSWQYLSEDLNEEQQRAVELIEQVRSLRAELPAVAEVLERIYEDSRRHRETLRQMLMRSDPQSHLSYLG
jgi:bacterioferritin (cytochrome b1)